LAYELGIHQEIIEIDIREQPALTVARSHIEFQPNRLTLHAAPIGLSRFYPKTVDGFAWLLGLWCVGANLAHFLPGTLVVDLDRKAHAFR
jgi:hypothetical protein